MVIEPATLVLNPNAGKTTVLSLRASCFYSRYVFLRLPAMSDFHGDFHGLIFVAACCSSIHQHGDVTVEKCWKMVWPMESYGIIWNKWISENEFM